MTKIITHLVKESRSQKCERRRDLYVFPFSSEEVARKFVKDFIRACDPKNTENV